MSNHFREEEVSIVQNDDADAYDVIFINHIPGGQDIHLRVPMRGVFDDPGRPLRFDEIETMAREIARSLQRGLI